jgi:hypothetical protein
MKNITKEQLLSLYEEGQRLRRESKTLKDDQEFIDYVADLEKQLSDCLEKGGKSKGPFAIGKKISKKKAPDQFLRALGGKENVDWFHKLVKRFEPRGFRIKLKKKVYRQGDYNYWGLWNPNIGPITDRVISFVIL